MKLHWHHWLTIVLGGWLIISPWVLGFYDLNLAVWNALIIGCGVILVTFWEALSRS